MEYFDEQFLKGKFRRSTCRSVWGATLREDLHSRIDLAIATADLEGIGLHRGEVDAPDLKRAFTKPATAWRGALVAYQLQTPYDWSSNEDAATEFGARHLALDSLTTPTTCSLGVEGGLQ